MPRPVLRRPYLDYEPGQPIPNCRVADTLNAVGASLWLLADLFVAPTAQCETLSSDSARLGMFNQLASIANTLEVLSELIGTGGEPDTEERA